MSQSRGSTTTKLFATTRRVLESNLFFRFVLALFVLQAGYIAIKSGYPLAFDEGFHVGVIQLHAQQWNPFLGQLPDSANQFGAVATDPSYLYHYLLSFPYRAINLVTNNSFYIVLMLRFISIAFFALGIVVYRKVLKFSGASNALIGLTILAFTMLPIVSFTAAQINYDNLLFLAVAIALLLCLKFTEKLRKTGEFDIALVVLLVGTCMLTTQVKYVFVPIFVAITGYTGYIILKWWRKSRAKAQKSIKKNYQAITSRTKLLLLGFIVISGGLFGWRIGYNVVQYVAVVPDCSKVNGIESCMQYGAWARNYTLSQTHTPNPSLSQQRQFAEVWTKISGTQLFSILDANKNGAQLEPTKQLVGGAAMIIIGGVVLLGIYWRRFWPPIHPQILFLLASGAYILSLLTINYSQFTEFGIPIAIQGRYLIPILPMLMVLLGVIYAKSFNKRPQIKLLVLLFAIIIGLNGAGALTYIKQTDQTWYWSDNAKNILPEPLTRQ